jgi:hypothetical protein
MVRWQFQQKLVDEPLMIGRIITQLCSACASGGLMHVPVADAYGDVKVQVVVGICC